MTWKVTATALLSTKDYVPIVGGEVVIEDLCASEDWAIRAEPYKAVWKLGMDNLPVYKVKRHAKNSRTGTLYSRYTGKTVNFIDSEFSDDLLEVWFNSEKQATRFIYKGDKADVEVSAGVVQAGLSIVDIVRAYFNDPTRVYYWYTKEGPVEMLPSTITALIMWIGYMAYGQQGAEGQLYDGYLLLLRNGIVPSDQAVATLRGMSEPYIRRLSETIKKETEK